MTPLTLSKIADLHAEEFRADFPAWLQANHAIYAEFERQALNIRRGEIDILPGRFSKSCAITQRLQNHAGTSN